MPASFDFLSLRLQIDMPQPDGYDWFELCVEPAESRWGWRFARPMIHETLHFWQLLASPYLGTLVRAELGRLEEFERTLTIPPESACSTQLRARDAETGFSAEQLLESWARYWEIQIQTPVRLLEQEGIGEDDVHPSLWHFLDPESPHYAWPWVGVEVAMTRGANCDVYGAPFRWMLQRVYDATGFKPVDPDWFSPNSANPCYLCCVAYPGLMYHSFRAKDPVLFFKQAVDKICGGSSILLRYGRFAGARYVQLDWFECWERLTETLEIPPDEQSEVPSHWGAFVPSARCLADLQDAIFEPLHDDPVHRGPALDDARAALDRHGLPVALAYMGYRPFRTMLGVAAAPPVLQFKDDLWVQPSYRATPEEKELLDEAIIRSLGISQRHAKFKRAQKAFDLGLPLDTFESA